MRRIWSLAKRNGKEILREPVSLAFLIGLPVVMEILFYYMFHTLTPQFEMRYLAPGLIGFANAFLALFLAILISMDRESAFITRIYTTPVRAYEFILGYFLVAIPLGLCQSAVILLVGGLLDSSFFSWSLLLVLPGSLLSIWMFSAVGILFGSVFNAKAVGGISSILITGQSVLSGMWFPLEGLPEGFLTVMGILPFKNISLLLQSIATPSSSFEDLWRPFLIVAAYTVACAALSCVLFIRNSKAK